MNMRNYLAAALLLITLGCSKTDRQKIEDNYQQGLNHLEEYDFEAARTSFADIAQIDSSSIWNTYGLALADEREMKLHDAMNKFFPLRKEHPDFYPAHQGIIRIYQKLGFPNEELDACLRAAEVSDDKLKSGLDIVEAFVNNNLIDQAMLQLKGMTGVISDRAVTDFIKARLYFSTRQEDSARAYLKQALENPTGTTDYYYHGANCFEAMGLNDSSISFSRKAWESAGDDRHEQMMRHFFRAVRTRNLFDAKIIMRDLKNGGAGEIMEAGLRRLYYIGLGETSMVRQAASDLRLYEPYSLSAIVAAAMSSIHASDFLGFAAELIGMKQMTTSGKIDQEMMSFIEYATTLEYKYSSDNGEAAVKLEKLDTVYASRPEVILNLVELYYRGGQFDKYEKAFGRVLAEHKNESDWLAGLAEVLTNRSVTKYEQALRLYEDALKVDPLYKPAFDGLLTLCEDRKLYDRFEEAFEKNPWFAQTFPGERIKRAINLIRLGRVNDGLVLFNESIPLVRGDINAFITALGLLGKSDPEKADLVAELMIELNPDNHDALLIAARYESDNSRYENGLALAEEIMEADPDHIPASVEKARANYYLGDRDIAFKAFEKIVKENMSDPDGNYYFSKLLAQEQIEPRRSGNLARRAFFHSDRSVKYVLNLCFVYFRAERFDLCRGEAKKALRQYSKEPELVYWLGMARYMDGKPKARATLDKAIELGLDGEYLTTAKETMAKL